MALICLLKKILDDNHKLILKNWEDADTGLKIL